MHSAHLNKTDGFLPPDIVQEIEHPPISAVYAPARALRTHTKKQIAQLAASIRQFKFFNPLIIDEAGKIIAGSGRLAAAKLLGMTHVPAIRLTHLSEHAKRLLAIADNRLAELAGWDNELLNLELKELDEIIIDLDFDLSMEITGFSTAEIDRRIELASAPAADAKLDELPALEKVVVSRLTDVWVLGKHRVTCGDARDPEAYRRLLSGAAARMVFTDPPYNVRVKGNISGKGKAKHDEFVMASGEMSEDEFTGLLKDVFKQMAEACVDGAILFVCMDWRHLAQTLAAGSDVFSELKNLVVWNKQNGGLGSFYRSQHELVLVYKVGTAPHLNTFGLGETGRYRTNVWSHPGLNSFGAGRDEDLAMHPTVKPVALVADAIKDVTRRGDIVLDAFAGSGSTLIAAEKTRRLARLIELDPGYVDCICRRWAKFSGQEAVLEGSGLTFTEVAQQRAAELEAANER